MSLIMTVIVPCERLVHNDHHYDGHSFAVYILFRMIIIHCDFECMHTGRTFVQLPISNDYYYSIEYSFREVTKLSKTGYVTSRTDCRCHHSHSIYSRLSISDLGVLQLWGGKMDQN